VIEAEGLAKVPIVEVWNKWDLLSAERAAELQAIIEARPDEIIVPASALTGVGSSNVLDRIGAMLTTSAKLHEFVVPAADGQRLAWLHAHGEVLEDSEAGEGETGPERRLTVRLTARELGRYVRL
jgi:GTP-binding protein HflX